MKAFIANLYQYLGWQVFFEELLCDVLATKAGLAGCARMIGIEVERSLRNLVRNVTKDLERGCDLVLVVVPDRALGQAVRRKLRRELPRDVWKRIGVVTMPQLRRALERLKAERSLVAAQREPLPTSGE